MEASNKARTRQDIMQDYMNHCAMHGDKLQVVKSLEKEIASIEIVKDTLINELKALPPEQATELKAVPTEDKPVTAEQPQDDAEHA